MTSFPEKQEKWLLEIEEHLSEYTKKKRPRWSAALGTIVMAGVCRHANVDTCSCLHGYGCDELITRNGDWARRVWEKMAKFDLKRLRKALLQDLRTTAPENPEYGLVVHKAYGMELKSFITETPDPAWFRNWEGKIISNWAVSSRPEDGFKAPEVRENPCLLGVTSEEKTVMTSPIKAVRGRIVETASGSLYGLVGDPSKEYTEFMRETFGSAATVWDDEPLKIMFERGYIR